MIIPNLGLQVYPPEPHQVDGTTFLMNRSRAFLGDTPGAGKSKQVIDAVCALFQLGEVDLCLVLCPAQVCLAWADPTLGEIQKHAHVKSTVTRFTTKTPIIPDDPSRLTWCVMSFELARMEARRRWLENELRGHRVVVVVDESLGLADTTNAQHRALKEIVGRHALYAWALNGTPGNPLQVYGQFEVLDPRVIGVQNVYHFKARYVQEVPIYPGSRVKKIVGYLNKDLFDARIADYVLRRTPPLSVARSVMPPMGVRLPPEAWRLYRELRDQALAELNDGSQVACQNAMARIMRLCQLTGGFTGGVEAGPMANPLPRPDPERWVHGAKVAAAVQWCLDRWREEDDARLIVWCRFTRERQELMSSLRSLVPAVLVLGLGHGDSTPTHRKAFLHELSPGTRSAGPGVGVAQPQAGGRGLTLTAAHDMLYYSSTWSWIDRDQTEGRTARHGQTADCRFWDLVAEGPEGQRTVDHKILEAVRKGADLAAWTVEDWRSSLEDENG